MKHFAKTLKKNYVFDDVLADTFYTPKYEEFIEGIKQNVFRPALMPPKRFLRAGSSFWVGANTRYVFVNDLDPHKGSKHISLIKAEKFNFSFPYVRLIKIYYNFMRDINSMREIKQHFLSYVYNLRTKALYKVNNTPVFSDGGVGNKVIKYRKEVKRIGINRHHVLDITSWCTPMVDRFFDTIESHIRKDTPNIADDCNEWSCKIISLNMQHRCNKAIPGITDILIKNLSTFATHRLAYNKVIRESGDYDSEIPMSPEEDEAMYKAMSKEVKAILAKTLYKFIPVLKDTGSMKKAIKTLLGENYQPLIPKLIFNLEFEDIAMNPTFMKLLKNYDVLVPKSLRHDIAGYIKQQDWGRMDNVMRNLVNMVADNDIAAHIKDSWIRTMRRLDCVIPWYLWRDMHNMSEMLGGIRIRYNRFNSVRDIRELHDRYHNAIEARNISHYAEVPKELITFIKLEYNDGVFYTNDVGSKFIFVQLITPADLEEESLKHGHCVRSYTNRCFEGSSVIFRLIINGQSVYTVEYSGDRFALKQAEGNFRQRPLAEVEKNVLIPFGRHLAKANRNIPLSYRVLSGLRADLIKMWIDLEELEPIWMSGNVEEEVLGEQMERYNCEFEERILLAKMIADKTTPQQDIVNQLMLVKDIVLGPNAPKSKAELMNVPHLIIDNNVVRRQALPDLYAVNDDDNDMPF